LSDLDERLLESGVGGRNWRQWIVVVMRLLVLVMMPCRRRASIAIVAGLQPYLVME